MKKKMLYAAILAALSTAAHAGSWLTFEAGIGVASAMDMNGVWNQHSVADNHEKLVTPSYLVGVTGDALDLGNWSLHYHADWVYMGTQSASCACVTDQAYAAHNYTAPTSQFQGSGHMQGLAFTIEPGYTWRGTRFAIEGGPFLFFTTWNETARGPDVAPDNRVVNVHAYGGATLGYVVGARIEHGHFGLSYRYYRDSPQWRASPGLVRSAQVLMVTYKF